MKSIGIDLGGTKGFFGVVDDKGNLEDSQRISSPNSWEEMKTLLVELVEKYQASHPDIKAVGFGVPGLIGTDGFAYFSPNFPSLNEGVDIWKELTDVLTVPVFIDNDNNCAGYAEAIFGAAKNSRFMISIGLGTGIGGAIVIDGQVFRGAHGFAGDFGHATIDVDGPQCACGKLGCFEALASGSALGRIARECAQNGNGDDLISLAGSIEEINGIHVGKAAKSGSQQAIEIIDVYARNVARGLTSFAESLDPETIVIAGGVVELGDILFKPLQKHFESQLQGDKSRPRPSIVPAHFGELAGVIGAGAMACHKLH